MVCRGGKTEYCNPNFKPLPNINQALLGYDMVVSDPLAHGGDPALRNQIFEVVTEDVVGRFKKDDGYIYFLFALTVNCLGFFQYHRHPHGRMPV